MPLRGQSVRSAVLFSTEIQGIEKKLGETGLSGAERRGGLIKLARLFTLAGNIERAAQCWTEAAFAEPGNRDDESLLAGARCLMALGEFDQAEAYIKTILLTGQNRLSLAGARYLIAQIGAFHSGDSGALASLTDQPEYADLNPSLFYTLWRITGDESYQKRLLSDYPASPEARLLEGAAEGPPLALWLLFPGRESAVVPGPVPAVAAGGTTGSVPSAAASGPAGTATVAGSAGSVPAATAGSPSGTTPAATAAVPPGPGTAPAGEAGTPAVLQTGLFSGEANARNMAGRLQAAGFSPSVSPRRVNGRDYWAVSVPPGTDMQGTIMRLKDAGFESFPVF
jgi:hypothetical protein